MIGINGLYRDVRFNDDNLWLDGYKAARQWFAEHPMDVPRTARELAEMDVFTEQLLFDLKSRMPSGGRWLPSSFPYHTAVKRVVFWCVSEHNAYGSAIVVRCTGSDEVKTLTVRHNNADPAEALANLKAIAIQRTAVWQADPDQHFPCASREERISQ